MQPSSSVEALPSVNGLLAARLRQRREERGISARALARAVGVSPSLVSQIETGKANPSVGTLVAIVTVLDVSLDEILSDATGRPDELHGACVLRSADRPRISLASGVQWERLTPRREPGLEFLSVTYEVGGASCPSDALMRHNGREYGLVLTGRLGATVGFDNFELAPGDSIVFACTVPHRFWTIGGVPCTAVWTVLEGAADNYLRSEASGPGAP